MSTRNRVHIDSGESTPDTTIGRTQVGGSTRTQTVADLVDQAQAVRDRSQLLAEDSYGQLERASKLHADGLDLLIADRTRSHFGRDVKELLGRLYDLGFSWTDIARMAGVSVPALRKWRHGESPSRQNRHRLATLVALCDIVPERSPMVQDFAAWLSMPLFPSGAPVTGIDLAAAGKFSLVVRYAEVGHPEQILDEFDPQWRQSYASNVEVFTAEDGLPGLRLRPQDG